MKPLIYGYMRVTDESNDAQVRCMEQQLARYAEIKGYHLGMIFYSYTPGQFSEFTELIDVLKRSEAHHVVVPSLDHLAHNPVLQQSLIGTLEATADAQVIEVGELG